MNKRIAKKRGAGKNFYQRIETPEGPTIVHVNRRGSTRAWTARDDEALQALVRAVRSSWRCTAERSHGPCNTLNGAEEESCGACGAARPTSSETRP